MAGAQYVRAHGTAEIGAHERELTVLLAGALESVPDLEVFAAADSLTQSGVLSVRHGRIGCEELGEALGRARSLRPGGAALCADGA